MSSNHVNPDVAIESFVLELRDTAAPNQATPQPNDRPVETS